MTGFRTEASDKLFKVIAGLGTEDECRAFFEDICTIKEIHDMAQRLEVATLIDSGMNYQEISNQTGASTATIGRVNRCLNYGDGGYRNAIEKFNCGKNE